MAPPVHQDSADEAEHLAPSPVRVARRSHPGRQTHPAPQVQAQVRLQVGVGLPEPVQRLLKVAVARPAGALASAAAGAAAVPDCA